MSEEVPYIQTIPDSALDRMIERRRAFITKYIQLGNYEKASFAALFYVRAALERQRRERDGK